MTIFYEDFQNTNMKLNFNYRGAFEHWLVIVGGIILIPLTLVGYVFAHLILIPICGLLSMFFDWFNNREEARHRRYLTEQLVQTSPEYIAKYNKA